MAVLALPVSISGASPVIDTSATRVVQKISRNDVPMDTAGFRNYWKSWCERLSEVPHVQGPDLHPLTPEQQAVVDNQNKPENQWVLHPEVDSCTPNSNNPNHGDDGPIIK